VWSLAWIKNRSFDPRRPKRATDSAQGTEARRRSVLQLKAGHALTAAHLKRIKSREDDQCRWWHRTRQTREHLFKHCSLWRPEEGHEG